VKQNVFSAIRWDDEAFTTENFKAFDNSCHFMGYQFLIENTQSLYIENSILPHLIFLQDFLAEKNIICLF